MTHPLKDVMSITKTLLQKRSSFIFVEQNSNTWTKNVTLNQNIYLRYMFVVIVKWNMTIEVLKCVFLRNFFFLKLPKNVLFSLKQGFSNGDTTHYSVDVFQLCHLIFARMKKVWKMTLSCKRTINFKGWKTLA